MRGGYDGSAQYFGANAGDGISSLLQYPPDIDGRVVGILADNINQSTHKNTVNLFFSAGCGHCKYFLPHFMDATDALRGAGWTVYAHDIQFGIPDNIMGVPLVRVVNEHGVATDVPSHIRTTGELIVFCEQIDKAGLKKKGKTIQGLGGEIITHEKPVGKGRPHLNLVGKERDVLRKCLTKAIKTILARKTLPKFDEAAFAKWSDEPVDEPYVIELVKEAKPLGSFAKDL